MSSMVIFLSLLVPVQASTIVVSSGGSIQNAINTAVNGDIVEIQSGTYLECLNTNGKNITLQGVGNVLLNGSSCSETVSVSSNEVVSIQDLQLMHTNGLVLNVSSVSASVSLSNVTVSGSGYSNQSQSSLGGVIYNEGNISIDNSTFTNNTGGSGGVIYTDGGFVSISNSTFSSNSGLRGGVLYAKDGATITSQSNTFENNTTVNGGSGGVFYFSFGVDLSETGSTYTSNVSDGSGGVLYANHNVGAFLPNQILIVDAIFESNEAGTGSFTTGSGGVLYVYNRSTVTISGSHFEDNAATNGGALWVVGADDVVTITDSNFTDNIADESGAIGVRAGLGGASSMTELDISQTSFTGNEANASYGGAIALGSLTISQSFGGVAIAQSIFDSNVAASSSNAHGGALFINTDDGSDVLVTDSIFQDNTAHSSGGAIYVTGAQDVDLFRNRFLDNAAESPASYDRYGGAVSINYVDAIDVNNSIFCGNYVNKFSTKTSYGGALYVNTVTEMNLSNTIVQDNESEENGGGLASFAVGDLLLVNNSFVGNTSLQGDGLWLDSSSTDLINNIFSDSSGSSAVYAADVESASGNISYNDWYSNTSDRSGSFTFSVSSNGNITSDPSFLVYSSDGDCSNDVLVLGSMSSLIDAGDPGRFDIDGTRSDIGAFGGNGLDDNDNDGYGALVDCDDSNAQVYPGAAFNESTTACMQDNDGDGYGDSTPTNSLVQSGLDCDDSDFNIKPTALELCDGVDNNCNNQIDDNPVNGTLYYIDADGDGFGSSTTIQSCTAVSGTSTETGDCDDLDPFAYPGIATLDSTTTCMRDVDGDGYGDSMPSNTSVTAGQDCDDMQININPSASEVPGDGIDQNCDSYEDCYMDYDLDGYGSSSTTSSTSMTCVGLAISANNDDCDDDQGQTFPGAAENDSATACMQDLDGDGYGWMFAPSGGVGGNDCDDDDPAVYLGATEIPGDGISQDCDNTEICYVDSDGDGYGSSDVVVSNDIDCNDAGESNNMADCDDSSVDISPDAIEIPYDGIDQDCNPSTADDDLDGDGYGVSDGDCDDANPDRNPGMTDIPGDGIDQDCDGEDATDDPEDTGEVTDTDDTSVEPGDTDTGGVTETPIDKTEGCSSVGSMSVGMWTLLFGLFSARRRR